MLLILIILKEAPAICDCRSGQNVGACGAWCRREHSKAAPNGLCWASHLVYLRKRSRWQHCKEEEEKFFSYFIIDRNCSDVDVSLPSEHLSALQHWPVAGCALHFTIHADYSVRYSFFWPCPLMYIEGLQAPV